MLNSTKFFTSATEQHELVRRSDWNVVIEIDFLPFPLQPYFQLSLLCLPVFYPGARSPLFHHVCRRVEYNFIAKAELVIMWICESWCGESTKAWRLASKQLKIYEITLRGLDEASTECVILKAFVSARRQKFMFFAALWLLLEVRTLTRLISIQATCEKRKGCQGVESSWDCGVSEKSWKVSFKTDDDGERRKSDEERKKS